MDRDAEIAELRARLAALEGPSGRPPSPAKAKGAGTFWVITASVGAVLAILGMMETRNASPKVAPTFDASSARVSAATQIASLSAQLPVTLGRGSREYGYTTYPIVVENQTGRALGYLQVNCSFYDASGTLIASEMTNWTNVASGARSSGTLTTRLTGQKRYECMATTSG